MSAQEHKAEIRHQRSSFANDPSRTCGVEQLQDARFTANLVVVLSEGAALPEGAVDPGLGVLFGGGGVHQLRQAFNVLNY
jgi:hypothetical protein